jgi:hypothetical protein
VLLAKKEPIASASSAARYSASPVVPPSRKFVEHRLEVGVLHCFDEIHLRLEVPEGCQDAGSFDGLAVEADGNGAQEPALEAARDERLSGPVESG